MTIEVSADALVSTSLPQRPLVEPHLAAHPDNPRHLVAATIVSVTDPADRMLGRCAALASFDGGRTWTAHQFQFPRCYDPWVAVLDDGTAILVALESDNSGAVPHMWLARSVDGGRSWPAALHSFGRSHDHPTLVVDRSHTRSHGALYVTSARTSRDAAGRQRMKTFVARSVDGGRTFAITEHELSNLLSTTTGAAVLDDGTLVVAATSNRRYVTDQRGTVPLRSRLYWAMRADETSRLGPPLLISDTCAGGAGRGWPVIAADLSKAATRGRLYAGCQDTIASGPYLMYSDDGGDRWSDPVRVAPHPAVDENERQNVNIAVNHDGVIGVSWHDRGPETTSTCWDVFAAFSPDGGATFTTPVKVTSQRSCPHDGPNGYAAEFFTFGGHYSGLAAAADGVFHVLWPDSRGRLFELRTATIRVKRNERRAPD